MRASLLSLAMAGTALAQGDLAGLLASQDDLSTLLELVALVPGLADTLSAASNITIFAPTNDAFDAVPREIPEGEAIEQKNDTVAISALLANHVFQGTYPAASINDVVQFRQTLLDDTYEIARQPFSNFTGGAYNGLVTNGDDVCVISGEQTISTVTEADIMLGEGITIHKVDTVLSFGPPLQLWTYRSGYTAMNAAIEAGQLGLGFGLTGAEVTTQNISDYTVFVPNNEAFEAIGSVLEHADLTTLQTVLSHHLVPSVVFSTGLANVTVQSLAGIDLTITVLPDGSAWVNGAKILFPNSILYNGIAHVIDNVLAPAEFDRATLDPSAPASERVAFPDAENVPLEELPFSTVSFLGDLMGYSTTPELLQTMAAVAPQNPEATTTGASTMSTAMSDPTTGASAGTTPPAEGAAGKLGSTAGAIVAIAAAVAAFMA